MSFTPRMNEIAPLASKFINSSVSRVFVGIELIIPNVASYAQKVGDGLFRRRFEDNGVQYGTTRPY